MTQEVHGVYEVVITRCRHRLIVEFPQDRSVEGLDLPGNWVVKAVHRTGYTSVTIAEHEMDRYRSKDILILAHRVVLKQEEEA